MGRLRREEDGEGKKGDEGREVGGRGQPWLTLIFTSRAVPCTNPTRRPPQVGGGAREPVGAAEEGHGQVTSP